MSSGSAWSESAGDNATQPLIHIRNGDIQTRVLVQAVQPSAGWTLALAGSVLSCIVGSSFLFGYGLGVINMPEKLMKSFYNSSYDERVGHLPGDELLTGLWSLTVGSFVLGGAITGFSGSKITELLGRKRSMIWSNIVTVVSCAMMFSSYWIKSYELLIVGRFVAGLQCGLSTVVAPQYLNEIAPLALRGACGTVHQLATVFGIFVSNIVGLNFLLGTSILWPYALAVPVVPALCQVIIFQFFPESPEWLYIYKGDIEESKKALRFLRNTENVDEELKVFDESAEMMRNTVQVPTIGLFKEPYLRKALLIAVMAQVIQQLCGVNSVVFFSTSIFDSANLRPPADEYATLGTGLTQVVVCVLSVFIVDRLGRRQLLLGGSAGLLVNLIILLVSLGLQDKVPWLGYLATASVFMFLIFFSIGPGPIPWFITPELFETGARSSAMGLAVLANWLCNMIVALGFPELQAALDFYAFLPFAVIVVVSWIFLFFALPETRNRTTEEIVQQLKGATVVREQSTGKYGSVLHRNV